MLCRAFVIKEKFFCGDGKMRLQIVTIKKMKVTDSYNKQENDNQTNSLSVTMYGKKQTMQ